jgi:hypothetical protein
MVPEALLEQTEHGLVPAGKTRLVLNALDARWIDRGEGRGASCMGGADSNWGAYTVDEAAQRHAAGVEQETADSEVAYARFANGEPTRYRQGWLPD